MLFRLLSLLLSALRSTFSESFVNTNYATFINFIDFRVYCNECTVAKILIKSFLLANNFGTGKSIKFGRSESIVTKCHIIKPLEFLKDA